jgi:hypothetical protein
MRYRKFNLKGLLDEAVRSVGNGARSCMIIILRHASVLWANPLSLSDLGVKVLKCVEGQFNKVFILTMDNDAELVVKIPNPNAGPAFYTTASEVATRHFVCE